MLGALRSALLDPVEADPVPGKLHLKHYFAILASVIMA